MSVATSFLLVPIAAFGFGEAFWVLVVTNFTLMHAVWISQLGARGNRRKVDFGIIRAVFDQFGSYPQELK